MIPQDHVIEVQRCTTDPMIVTPHQLLANEIAYWSPVLPGLVVMRLLELKIKP